MPPKEKLKPDKGQRKLGFFVSESPSDSNLQAARPCDLSTASRSFAASSSSSNAAVISDQQSSGSETKVKVRQFQEAWNKQFPWVLYDGNAEKMFCILCQECKRYNSFTKGCSNFRKSSLQDHIKTEDHQTALATPQLQNERQVAEEVVYSKKEKAMGHAVRAMHWIVAEDLALVKFTSFMQVLEEYDVADIKELNVSSSVNYTSRTTATDLLAVFAEQVDEEADRELGRSVFISVLADETTDMTVKKRMGIYVKTVDDNMNARTRFLTNLQLEHGTGKAIAHEIVKEMDKRGVPMNKVIALGSDGAATMTGLGNGVTGRLRRENPHLINIHCIAHRLALCTSQAAEQLPALKAYQETLTSLFYYFKVSANRVQSLTEIQEILDSPQLKIKEVHSIRWLSFYNALETVYRSLNPLLVYLGTERRNDPKAIGLKKKIATQKFISLTYILMDIIPVIGQLNLFFQAKEIDIALVKVKTDRCINTLKKMKEEGAGQHKQLLQDHMKRDEDGHLKYKEHVITGCSQEEIASAETRFLDNIIDNMGKRFPETDLISAFGVLAMRPISTLSKEHLDEWGNEKINILMKHFAEQKESHWEDEDGVTRSNISEPVISASAAEVQEEWKDLKETVKEHMYPRDNFVDLWKLIAQYHPKDFQHMKKLAQIGLVLPVHTADVERGFSAQNQLCTAKRNRLSVEHQDMLLKQKLAGQQDRTMPYIQSIVKRWREKSKGQRKLFEAGSKN